jgi:hypothetical protein
MLRRVAFMSMIQETVNFVEQAAEIRDAKLLLLQRRDDVQAPSSEGFRGKLGGFNGTAVVVKPNRTGQRKGKESYWQWSWKSTAEVGLLLDFASTPGLCSLFSDGADLPTLSPSFPHCIAERIEDSWFGETWNELVDMLENLRSTSATPDLELEFSFYTFLQLDGFHFHANPRFKSGSRPAYPRYDYCRLSGDSGGKCKINDTDQPI